MPCIQVKTNVTVSEQAAQAVKSGLGKMISAFPGKTEQWLMITLEDGCSMWFRGETGFPMAMVEVKILGNKIDRAASEKMTEKVCGLFQKELGVEPQNLYIRYTADPDWGWNGSNF